MRIQAALFAVLIAGCAREDSSLSVGPVGVDLQTELQGRIAGPPQSCINMRHIRSTRVANGGEALLFEDRGNILYVTRPHGGCTASLGGHIRTVSQSTRLCRADGVEIVGPGGSGTDRCTVTDFVPYGRAG